MIIENVNIQECEESAFKKACIDAHKSKSLDFAYDNLNSVFPLTYALSLAYEVLKEKGDL